VGNSLAGPHRADPTVLMKSASLPRLGSATKPTRLMVWNENWFNGFGDGWNYSASDPETNLEYSPIYQANYNSDTSQFWVGATDSVELDYSLNLIVKEFLNLHLYVCDIVTMIYNLRVTYPLNGEDVTQQIFNQSKHLHSRVEYRLGSLRLGRRDSPETLSRLAFCSSF
jgi:hypothetical protein